MNTISTDSTTKTATYLHAEGVHLGEVRLVELRHRGDGVALVSLLLRPAHYCDTAYSIQCKVNVDVI